MKRHHPVVRKLTTSALAVGLGLGLTAAIASPARADSCQLIIGPGMFNGFYTVGVACASGIPMTYSLHGSDTPFDEFRGGPFGNGAQVSRGVLNEDDSFWNSEDEVYARTANGTRTNTVVRFF